MKPVDQTIFGANGNCLQAAIASILEVPLEEVPDANKLHLEGKNWVGGINAYLRDKHGLWMVELKIGKQIEGAQGWNLFIPDCYHIMGGVSPRGVEAGHAVVGKRGQMVHDPHPDRTGLTKVEDFIFFIALK